MGGNKNAPAKVGHLLNDERDEADDEAEMAETPELLFRNLPLSGEMWKSALDN